MNARFRFVAALCALVAFALSGAEAAWASTCPPPAAVASVDAADGGAAEGGMGCDREGSRAPGCPLGPVAAAGSCVAAPALPASEFVSSPTAPEGALLIVSCHPMRDLLSGSAFFRPPRA